MVEWPGMAAEAAAVFAVGESQRFCAPALIGCIFVVGGGSVKGGGEKKGRPGDRFTPALAAASASMLRRALVTSIIVLYSWGAVSSAARAGTAGLASGPNL